MKWTDFLNPTVVVGGAAGAYVGHSKWGKSHGHWATMGGLVGGAVAGWILTKVWPSAEPVALPEGQGEFVQMPVPEPTVDLGTLGAAGGGDLGSLGGGGLDTDLEEEDWN